MSHMQSLEYLWDPLGRNLLNSSWRLYDVTSPLNFPREISFLIVLQLLQDKIRCSIITGRSMLRQLKAAAIDPFRAKLQRGLADSCLSS